MTGPLANCRYVLTSYSGTQNPKPCACCSAPALVPEAQVHAAVKHDVAAAHANHDAAATHILAGTCSRDMQAITAGVTAPGHLHKNHTSTLLLESDNLQHAWSLRS